MYFKSLDVQQFLAQKQFIDTAMVPLLSVDLSESAVIQSSTSADFLMSLTSFVEQQFKGRVLVFPPFTYFEKDKTEDFVKNINEEIEKFGFKHVIFITCDHFWKTQEDLKVVWLPSIPLESMDAQMKNVLLGEQLKQIVPVLTAIWSNPS